ncbi:NAD(P)/FAD-dependent oxidoreductase [Simiduia agarivorans]|uniref:NAD(P)/FAD-dependent oxidoreductase n=1 Tax=Simiduia agarivorans TaxID=447471 RepID=UPI00028AB6B9|nr:NAD(P)/FAD-dependent oxidoreductase [Simiduia agarivorans]
MKTDVVVVGAGAAGLMCAAQAGYRGRSVLVLDHANKPGKKILMSGGGRCNFTNLVVEPRHYLSANPHFCKSALARYKPQDFIELVERHGVPYHEKTKGQLFCDNKASDILNLLLTECEWAGATVKVNCGIDSVKKTGEGFVLQTAEGEVQCASLVVATGGLSIPTLGATGWGFQIAEQFGHHCLPRWASLVPFTFSDRWQPVFAELSGLSVDVQVTCNGTRFHDPLLFTHRGLSGPAMLQISNYWQLGDALTLDFLPGQSVEALIKDWQQAGVKAELKNQLASLLPKRFVQQWLDHTGVNKPVHQLTVSDVESLADALHRFQVTPSGTEGYRTAEVTLGGIDTREVSSKTFESNKVQGLYFIGEVLDVTGWLGGYNFQWAWASGFCAGQFA